MILKICGLFGVSTDHLLGFDKQDSIRIVNSFNNSANNGNVVIGNNNRIDTKM